MNRKKMNRKRIEEEIALMLMEEEDWSIEEEGDEDRLEGDHEGQQDESEGDRRAAEAEPPEPVAGEGRHDRRQRSGHDRDDEAVEDVAEEVVATQKLDVVLDVEALEGLERRWRADRLR